MSLRSDCVEVAKDLLCHSCGAEPGSECTTRSGRATRLHECRLSAAVTRMLGGTASPPPSDEGLEELPW